MRTPCTVVLLLGAAANVFAMRPPAVNEISPKDGAVGVPVDTEIRVELETAQEDPGLQLFEAGAQTEVPLKTVRIDRWKHEGQPSNPLPGTLSQGASCVFKPLKALKPQTRYKIHCRLRGCDASFTTGAPKPSKPRR